MSKIIRTSFEVASFTDAWIETLDAFDKDAFTKVASFTDAWIETKERSGQVLQWNVASFTDAWIETHWYEMSEDSICRIFYRCVD